MFFEFDDKFLLYYILYRKHGSLKKELIAKTPFDAIEKQFTINPITFKQNSSQFKNKVVFLPVINASIIKQPCETR